MGGFKISGRVDDAAFTLTLHRGEEMCLLAMNWCNELRPHDDFVGFVIEYQGPQAADDATPAPHRPARWWTLNNRCPSLTPAR